MMLWAACSVQPKAWLTEKDVGVEVSPCCIFCFGGLSPFRFIESCPVSAIPVGLSLLLPIGWTHDPAWPIRGSCALCQPIGAVGFMRLQPITSVSETLDRVVGKGSLYLLSGIKTGRITKAPSP